MPRSSLRPPARTRALLGAAVIAGALVALVSAAEAVTPRVHAITNARIVVAPGQTIPRGTIVMRDGLITAVGANVAIPADARVWPGDSLTVYAGLVDAFVLAGAAPAPVARGPGGRPAPAPAESPRGAASNQPTVRAEYRVVETLEFSKDQLESLRAAGFAAAQVAPRQGIVRGQSVVVGLGDGALNANTIAADASQVIALDPTPNGYPGSLMGAIALIRQTFLDARWYRDAGAAYARRPLAMQRPETNVSWAALQPAVAGTQTVLFVADEMLEVLRGAAISGEAEVRAQIVGAGDEYKRVAAIAATEVPLVVPVNFPDAPNVADDANALEITTEELRQWQDAPGNAAALTKAGVTFALTANGLKDVKTFRSMVAKAIARGLTEDQALAAVTTTPARMLGLESRLGTLAPGKVANLTVVRGALFGEQGKVREVWVDGTRYEVAKDETTPKGDWSIDWGSGRGALSVSVDKDTVVKVVVGADTLKATNVQIEGKRLRFTVTPAGGPAEHFDVSGSNDVLTGSLGVTGAGSHDVRGTPRPKDEKGGAKDEPKFEPVASPLVMGNSEPWRMSVPAQPAAVLIRNATIWTAGPQGTLQNADLLIRSGRIAAVGKNLSAPGNAVVVDGTDKHVAPGILDEHSHAAVLGNVNECTNNITCEVRVQDVINSENVNIYRQLAGGTTIMHLLHGSCNSIGGQCAVIRNKWGAAPDQLFMTEAPGTVKFALGENPKQANWGADRTNRYPKSRAGVEQSIREAFEGARDYDRAWAEFRAGQRTIPPRRDLQLDALSEIVNSRRFITCHSYRQDEILALMRLTEEFGFKVNTFTHILEGYKVADEMATHGASAMGFTDWWAYKQEVIDAIPWNGYLMWDRGVNVGFNSDNDELARRLNTEAAKAIKYGGMPPEEAIKTVTLNPAKALRIDQHVGSLEPGKDADFSIWTGTPLSPYSVCEQTWIEGRKYFDRQADLAGRDALTKERAALIAKAKAAAKPPGSGPPNRGNWPPRYLEDTDMSGNDCGHGDHGSHPFLGESARRAATSEAQR